MSRREECCPACGRAMPPKLVVSGPVRQRLADVIANRPNGTTSNELMDLVYAEDVNGGPDCVGTVAALVFHANKQLAPQGYRITSSGGCALSFTQALMCVVRRLSLRIGESVHHIGFACLDVEESGLITSPWRIPARAEQRRERKAEAAKAAQTDHRAIAPQRNGAPSPDAAQNTHQRAGNGRWHVEPNSVETEQAHKLLREQLASGSKPGSQIEALAAAAEIPESALIAAPDTLGVRTQRG